MPISPGLKALLVDDLFQVPEGTCSLHPFHAWGSETGGGLRSSISIFGKR